MLDGQAAKGRERRPAARVEHCPAMAKRPSTPADLREAVERTVQATLGSAERQRERTQGALDDLAGTVDQVRKGAEAGIARGRKAVAGAIESGRPATYEDIRDVQAELRRISRRLDAIEERLPAKRRSSGGPRPSAGPRGRPRALVTRARASRSAAVAAGDRVPGRTRQSFRIKADLPMKPLA